MGLDGMIVRAKGMLNVYASMGEFSFDSVREALLNFGAKSFFVEEML